MTTSTGYPTTRTERVADSYHGKEGGDPYRWLEDAESEETRTWVDEQNDYTASILQAVPGRERLQQRLAELLNIGIVGAPYHRGGHYFYTRRDAGQNQAVLWVREGLEGQ